MPERKPTIHKPKRDDLPAAAFAIVGDPQDAGTWLLPHHTREIFRPIHDQVDKEKLALHNEQTVDWSRMSVAVASLSRYGYHGKRVKATPEQIIHAARHLAEHHRLAGLSVPDTLGALI